MAQLNLSAVARAAFALAMLATAPAHSQSLSFVGSALCSPASITPAVISLIRPHSSIAAVSATLGCAPTEWVYAPEVNATLYIFRIPLLNNVGVYVTVDSLGVAFAEWVDVTIPLVGTYAGALRVEPPLTPNWMPAAGAVPVP